MERASKPPVWPPGDTTQPQCTAQLKQSSDEMTRMEIHTSRSFLPGTLICWIDHHLGLTSVPSVTNSKAGIDGQQSILLGRTYHLWNPSNICLGRKHCSVERICNLIGNSACYRACLLQVKSIWHKQGISPWCTHHENILVSLLFTFPSATACL